MAIVQLATTITAKVKRAVEKVCKMRGFKMNKFIEEALLDKLEELEDAEEITTLRQETTRPLAAILRELKADGKL